MTRERTSPPTWPKQAPFDFNGRILANPSQESLRALALEHTPHCIQTKHGSLNKIARNKARMAKYTYVIDRQQKPELYSHQTIDEQTANSLIEGQRGYMAAKGELIRIDGYVGAGPRAVACQWYYTAEAANIAGMQQVLAFPRSAVESATQQAAEFDPNFRLFYTPDYRPDMPGRQAIIVDLDNYITYIMGPDYFGESKKGALRMLAALHFRNGGLVMHAGAKTITHAESRQSLAVLGLSGTGKTTTTFSKQGDLTRPVQDDMLTLWPDAEISVTENGCFAKTFGLNPKYEPVLHAGTCRRESWLENVFLDEEGEPCFDKGKLSPAEVTRLRQTLVDTGAPSELVDNYAAGHEPDVEAQRSNWAFLSWTENGRSIIPMSCVEDAEDPADLPGLRSLGILNRDEGEDAAMPGLVRFRDERQAAAFFMLGETSKTSAAGSDRGKTRSPFTQPFFPLAHHHQAERFLELARGFSDTQMWLMNTGYIGGDARAARDGKAIDIRIHHSNALLEALISGQIRWVTDPDFGYDVVDIDAPENAELLQRVPAEILQPRRWFDRHDRTDTYLAWVDRIKAERRSFLQQHGVPAATIAAIEGVNPSPARPTHAA